MFRCFTLVLVDEMEGGEEMRTLPGASAHVYEVVSSLSWRHFIKE